MGRVIEKIGLQDRVEGMRSEYSAAKLGRFKKQRRGLMPTGSGADYHYRNITDYLRIMEYARDMDRNDSIVGQMINRAVLNTIQDGFMPDPDTGDTGLNTELINRWNAWANDPRQCDMSGEKTFTDIEELAFRSSLIDGDCFLLPTNDGPIEFVEAHRLRTPSSTKRNVVCGILLDDNRRRLEYWITKEDVDPGMPVALVGDVEKVAAFRTDEDTGEALPNVLHIGDPKRYSQTRFISALAPVFDFIGMHDDLEFAKLVQQQVASCIAIIRNRASDWKPAGIAPYGKQYTEYFDAQQRLVEEIAPGMELRGLPGETVSGFSPNIPNSEFFQQMRTILQIIGINLGLPLVLLLMDASDTNFSGWRGAMDQAKMGFRRNQRWLREHMHTPLWGWKLRQFIRDDPRMLLQFKKVGAKFFKHDWNCPRWAYIQPLQDAQATQLRKRDLQASPRMAAQDSGFDHNEIIRETVADNSFAIEQAAAEAKALSARIGQPVTWRELLFMTDADMYKAATASATAANTAAAANGGGGDGPEALNGLQITSAIEIFNKLRDDVLVKSAAKELLLGLGLNEQGVDAAIEETVNSPHQSSDTVTFERQVLAALLTDPTTRAIVANATPIAGEKGLVGRTGLPVQTNFTEDWVVAPVGSLVGGDTPPSNPPPGAEPKPGTPPPSSTAPSSPPSPTQPEGGDQGDGKAAVKNKKATEPPGSTAKKKEAA